MVSGTLGLGDETRRRHAQEAEAPIDVGEDEGAQRHAAEIGGIGEMTHHRRIDRTHQRNRKIGDDDG
ncbi:hypothetical protein D3C83_317320 [compost metagenome]